MLHCTKLVHQYLVYCEYQKNLSTDTLKAYRIDLTQFTTFLNETDKTLNREGLINYIARLHVTYRPRTAKRKVATLKAFCTWLEYEELIECNPFDKIRVKFNEPQILPRTIPLETVEAVLHAAYDNLPAGGISAIRDVAILEMLFAVGVRVSELCHLTPKTCNLQNGTVLILGKGAKERLLQIGNPDVLTVLRQYYTAFSSLIDNSGWFFINRLGRRYSEQSVRSMLYKYLALAGSNLHVTPHMFRHTFATQLLEEDVDIRYIQSLLGHSSITTTQIYTHVTSKKQLAILSSKHPRNRMAPNCG